MKHLHTLKHTEINSQSILKKREYRRLTSWAKETKSDISQLKVELTNTQSRKLEPEQSANWGMQQREYNNLTYIVKRERVKEKKRRKRKGMGGRGS